MYLSALLAMLSAATASPARSLSDPCVCSDPEHPYCAPSDSWCYDLTHKDLQSRRRFTRRRHANTCPGTCAVSGVTTTRTPPPDDGSNSTDPTTTLASSGGGSGGGSGLDDVIGSVISNAMSYLKNNPEMMNRIFSEMLAVQATRPTPASSITFDSSSTATEDECEDDNSMVKTVTASYGYPVTGCGDLASFCDHATMGEYCQRVCPQTCGACGAREPRETGETAGTTTSPVTVTRDAEAGMVEIEAGSGAERRGPALAAGAVVMALIANTEGCL